MRYTREIEGVIHEEHVSPQETERVQTLEAHGWKRADAEPDQPTNQPGADTGRFAPIPNTVPESFNPAAARRAAFDDETTAAHRAWQQADAQREQRQAMDQGPSAVGWHTPHQNAVDALQAEFGRAVTSASRTPANAAQNGGATVQVLIHGQFLETRFDSFKSALEWVSGLAGGADAPTQVFIGTDTGAAG